MWLYSILSTIQAKWPTLEEDNTMKKIAAVAAVVAIAGLAACGTSECEKNKLALEQANAEIAAAKLASEQAAARAQAAEQKAIEAAEKNDRMFKKGLHK